MYVVSGRPKDTHCVLKYILSLRLISCVSNFNITRPVFVQDVARAAKVTKVPMYQLYAGGMLVDSYDGASPQDLQEMIATGIATYVQEGGMLSNILKIAAAAVVLGTGTFLGLKHTRSDTQKSTATTLALSLIHI